MSNGGAEMETEIRVRKKYQITLPTVIREAAGVYEGDFLTAEVREDHSILLRPSRPVGADAASADAEAASADAEAASADAEAASGDEAFFYTPEWQAAEREADEDIRLGRVYHFDNVEEAIDFLHNHDPEDIERDDAD